MQWRRIKTFSKGIWKAYHVPYYLLVQKRKGGKSHPNARYYWRVSISQCDYLIKFSKYDYEMSSATAKQAAEGAVLEAKICGTMVTR
ncbi:MAG: hypothetical protein DRQ01_00820 [Ignavibacteriae bacterium]|nr:MAG: hypothetical protein DRQ01_00820 [Ignavibacteriota bacterium]